MAPGAAARLGVTVSLPLVRPPGPRPHAPSSRPRAPSHPRPAARARARAVKHNNVLPNVHYRKEWDLRVKTWLDQPARKHRRRMARKAKAAAAFPRPVDKLRPTVRGQTVKYNTKTRVGRGFSLEELKAAGLAPARARQVGVAVDHRRTNKSEASLNANVAALKDYVGRLVVASDKQKPRARFGEVAADAAAPLARGPSVHRGAAARAANAKPAAITEYVAVTAAMTDPKKRAHRALRQEWTNARLRGLRAKKAAEAAAEKEKSGDKKEEA